MSHRAVAALSCLVLLAGCTGSPPPPASGDPDGTTLVLGVADEPASLDPLDGYAPFGAAQLFDGLVEHSPGGPRPALAAALPTPSPDGRSWTATLRTDVSFTDGSGFDAEDVVATYRGVLAADAPLRTRFWMLAGVQAVGKTTVRFDLTAPFAAFPELLTLGVRSADPAADPPVGTGPYELVAWTKGVSLELKANQAYFAGPPAITKVTLEFLPDDQARAQRMREGKLDGAALPGVLAEPFEREDGLTVVEHASADLCAVDVPAASPAADPALRLALNLAVDRESLVEDVLDDAGEPASQPVPPASPEFVEPAAALPHDPARARATLDAAGWLPGPDGVRAREGVRAAFDLAYPRTDVVAEDLATAFAAAAKAIGVAVTPKGQATTAADPAVPRLVSFGDPFDPDRALHPLLNPAGGALAAALAAERASTDPAQRAVAFRALQRAYAAAPTLVVLAQVDHSYVLRENWNGYQPVVDATGTDHTWGPWWNLATWTPR
ncbi:ABC transporter substrate-binding protein [Actinokineospora sp. G85]|uniref:ABC transporter substrate-binding protein n=1 Tax=Actinokineospora sp. G85 TaxID=3406626 RepID=UPI003C7696C6